MSCASATGGTNEHDYDEEDELSNAFDAELDGDSCFILAETQDKLSVTTTSDTNDDDNGVGIGAENDDDDDDDEDDEEVDDANDVSDDDNSTAATPAANSSAATDCYADADDISSCIEQDHLLEYHTDAATETVNLLLPEPTTALDCGNFVDFDEFNLCLNNILSDDDELSANEMMGGGRLTQEDGQFTLKQSSNWNKMLTPNNSQIDDILNIAQLSDDLDLNFYHSQQVVNTNAATNQQERQQQTEEISSNQAAAAKTPEATTTTTTTTTTLEIIQQTSQQESVSLVPQSEQVAQEHGNSASVGGSSAMDVISRNSHSIVNIFQ